MPADAVAAPEIESLVLRVLAGRVRGASAPLERGRVIALGHDLDADIVLRDASAEGVRLTLKARADAADLDLTSGAVTLLGHELTAPAQAILPLYLPLLIGDNAVAIGEAELMAWCKSRLAGFKVPRGYTFLRDEEMPRNATGKVLHRALKLQLQK